MESFSPEELREWVGRQTALLEPPAGWSTDATTALTRLHERAVEQASVSMVRRWPAWAAAAAILIGGVLALPEGRVAAQQFWQFLTVPRMAVIQVKDWPEGVPSPAVKLIGTPLPPIPARDLEEARWRVHYDPRIPRPGVLAQSPKFLTTFSMAAGTVVNTADLELAMQKAGITDQRVPPEWNGAHLALHTSAMVIAQWPDLALVQSLPLTLTAPAGFDFSAFSALVLKIVGVAPEEARQLAQRMGTIPQWLAPLARENDDFATIEEIRLNSGPATLYQERDRAGKVDRTTLFWSVPDRVYALDGTLSRELTIAVANAVQ